MLGPLFAVVVALSTLPDRLRQFGPVAASLMIGLAAFTTPDGTTGGTGFIRTDLEPVMRTVMASSARPCFSSRAHFSSVALSVLKSTRIVTNRWASATTFGSRNTGLISASVWGPPLGDSGMSGIRW